MWGQQGVTAMSTSTAAVRVEQPRAQLFEVPRLESYSEPIEAPAFASRQVRQRRVTGVLLASDAAMMLGSALAATAVYERLMGPAAVAAALPYGVLSVLVTVATLLAMISSRLYSIEALGWGSAEFTRVGRAVGTGIVGTVLVFFLMGLPGPSRLWVALAGAFSLASVIAARGVLRTIASHRVAHTSWLQRPTLIVGSNGEAADLASLLRLQPTSGLVPVGCLRSSQKDQLSFDYCAPCLPTLGTARDLGRVIEEHGIDTVIIVSSAFDYAVTQRMIKDLRDLSVTVHISSALNDVLSSRVVMREVSGVPLISLRGVSLSEGKVRGKRAFDSLVAGAIVAAGMPLWAVLALMIKLTSRGPVFYRQERIGRGGVPFKMFKFRSMVTNAEAMLRELEAANQADGPLFKMKDDPRVTSVGRWMRKFSLDEFPQLLNVVRGEMSLVGPRPPLPRELMQYTEHDFRRLEVLPGMTGLWQVSGRSKLTFRDMVRLDTFYIDNWSLGLDLSLLVRTVPAVVLARGAY